MARALSGYFTKFNSIYSSQKMYTLQRTIAQSCAASSLRIDELMGHINCHNPQEQKPKGENLHIFKTITGYLLPCCLRQELLFGVRYFHCLPSHPSHPVPTRHFSHLLFDSTHLHPFGRDLCHLEHC